MNNSHEQDIELRDRWCNLYAKTRDVAEMLWIVLANVDGGHWGGQTKEWQEAAAKYRDELHEIINVRA